MCTSVNETAYGELLDIKEAKVDLKSKSIRGSAITMVTEVVNLLVTIGATSILARILSPSDFGLLGMVFALTAIAERFKDIGLGRATIQKQTITHPEVSNLFWLNTAIGVAISLGISGSSGVIAGFYHEQRLIPISIALSLTFVFSSIIIQHQALLVRRMRFGVTGTIGTCSHVVSNVFAIFLALKGFGYWSLVWREIVRSIFIAAATWICCPWIPSLPDAKVKVARLMSFGRDITLFNLVTFFTRSVDQILLGRYSGAAALGIYRQAFQLIMLPLARLTSPMQSVSEPVFSAVQDEVSKYRNGFQKAVHMVSLLTMPIAAGVFVCARPLVLLLLGAKWSAAEAPLRILAAAAFLRPAISTMGFVMVTSGKTARYAVLGLLDSIILITAIVIGLRWGATGVAFGHLAATYIVFLPFLWWAFQGTPVSLALWLHSIKYPAICSVFMGVSVYYLSKAIPFLGGVQMLSCSVITGVLSYGAAMIMLPGGRSFVQDMFYDCRQALRI
jgi:PST family polysaccharide transporter